ncbi:unnamed protein product [Durusdinium trenchii]|uniref:Uncharacterized protein n=2 Tax=Durusdinium trenchii TaxID=1381693 RepID=A0ABP0MTW1_9DINO
MLQYSKFDNIDTDTETDADSPNSGAPRTEEGLFQAFLILHQRREQLDKKILGQLPALSAALQFRPRPQLRLILEAAVDEYDDICQRVLALDGVRQESALRSVGHRHEISVCRLTAARALQAMGCSEEAEGQSTQAIIAASVPSKNAPAFDGLSSAISMLYQTRVDALLVRSMTRLSRGDFNAAHRDALDAHSDSRSLYLPQMETTALEMAMRCEMALHAGGPGEDGKGTQLSPEDACNIDFRDKESWSLLQKEARCAAGETSGLTNLHSMD